MFHCFVLSYSPVSVIPPLRQFIFSFINSYLLPIIINDYIGESNPQ